MHRRFQSLLLGTAIVLASMTAQAADKSKNSGISISAAGVTVDVGLDGKQGVTADVDASIGGKNGINADVDAAVGGKNSIAEADVDATIGGKNGVNAGVNATVGGKNTLKAKVNAAIGNTVDVEGGVNLGNRNSPRSAVVDPGTDPGADPGGALTSQQRQAFNAMSAADRKAMLKRCASIGAGGYDPALVRFCKLLRMSASR